jgi:transposase
MTLDHASRCVGIDVSKAHLDIAILPGPTTTRVANTPRGWQALLRHLRGPAPVTIALEATGRYHRGVTAALATAGHPAAVLNPAWTHAFARSEGRLAKTDRVDAEVLARYAQQKQPAPTPVPSATTTAVVDLAAYREDLVAMRTMEQNRVQVMAGPVAAFITAHIAELHARIAAVEQELAQRIAADAE